MCMTMSSPAFAVDSENNSIASDSILEEEICTNEYDYIVGVRTASANELQLMNISEDEIAYINSDAIESELMYRATLSDEILSDHYCYTDEEIEILREYDGTPLEQNSELRSITATLTATLTSIVNTSTRTGLLYTWNWSTKPLINLTDIVAVSWDCTYENSGDNNLKLNKDDSFANIQYYATSEDQQGATVAVDSDQAYYGGYAEIPMEKYYGVVYHWAKSGGAYFYADIVDKSGNYDLIEVSAHAEYAHYTLDVSLSFGVSFTPEASISFVGTCDIHGKKNLIVNP